MKSNRSASLPTTRREFLKDSTAGIGLLAFSSFAPSFLTQSVFAGQPAAEKDRSILVLIQLGGGNDGLNTLIPYTDDQYYRLRPTLALRRQDSLAISDELALHPSCGPLEALFKDGSLAIAQNVGYPNPNRSHFRSMEIWETASDSRSYLSSGWLGRFFDNCCGGTPSDDPIGVTIGDEMPDAFLSASNQNLFAYAGGKSGPSRDSQELLRALRGSPPPADHANASFLQHTLMNALVTEERVVSRLKEYRPLASYPNSELAQSLRNVAALIAAGQSTRVYYVARSGFDTHAGQLAKHAALLGELAEAMSAFQQDLVAHKLQDQVLTMTFSEFGRRPSENRSGGTDHGTAAPLFIMGSKVKGGLHGRAPSLALESNQDLVHSTDFRSVYATIIDSWLQGDSAAALGDRFETLPLL